MAAMDTIKALIVADADILSLRAVEEWTYKQGTLLSMGIAAGPLASSTNPEKAASPQSLLGDVSVVLEHLENITCRIVYVASSRDHKSLVEPPAAAPAAPQANAASTTAASSSASTAPPPASVGRMPRMTPHSMNIQRQVLPLAPGLNVTGYTTPDSAAGDDAGGLVGRGSGLGLGLDRNFWSALLGFRVSGSTWGDAQAQGAAGGREGGGGNASEGGGDGGEAESGGAGEAAVEYVDFLLPSLTRLVEEASKPARGGTAGKCRCILATSLPEGAFPAGEDEGWCDKMGFVYGEEVALHVLAPLPPRREPKPKVEDSGAVDADDRDPRGPKLPPEEALLAGADEGGWDKARGRRQAVQRIGGTVCVWPGSLYEGEFAIATLARAEAGWEV
eukprot:CAMPEP_0118881452 /NCGR_PEP_ID=MMETSP1163-20130328/20908_1 /TAXON_ID=124430 /ORGANISM="Phaeomonas parva, Strain CCMP2877" /LENGTH=389 /DNA_ID=CAMNT_0006818243 /DNA_START=320 /DNA_END=1486 /DNA_ORIENTATION=-